MRENEEQFCLNLAVECWKRNPNPERWPALVADWIGERQDVTGVARYPRSEGLLLGEVKATPEEIDLIAERVACSADDLLYVDGAAAFLPTARMHNVRRLMGSWHGTQKELARALGVTETTVSRWKNGQQEPDSAALRSMSKLFHLGSPAELDSPRQFLSFRPVTHNERLSWLRQRLDRLSTEESAELFPAFERLLRHRG